MTMKIGLLVGMEDTFPAALLERLQDMGDDVIAEMVTLGGTDFDEACPYDVILDRISHEVGYYRAYARHARLSGTRVINDPFLVGSDDRFFDASFARRLGVKVPKAVLLPQKSYPETVSPASLRNLTWPVPFDRHFEFVGAPALLRSCSSRGLRHATRVTSYDELMAAYDRTGTDTMMLQEAVPWSRYVRCVVIGGDRVIVARYDPEYRQYLEDADYLEPELEERIVRDASAVASGLGYGVCAVEFAIAGDEPFAVEFLNPAPDFERSILTPYWFDKVVEASAGYLHEQGAAGREEVDVRRSRGVGLVASVTDLGPAPAAAKPAAGGKKTRKKAAPPSSSKKKAGKVQTAKRKPSKRKTAKKKAPKKR